MSTSSGPKKVKKKSTITQLKIIETVSKHSYNTIKLEEIKTPQDLSQITTSMYQILFSFEASENEGFDQKPIDFNMDSPDLPNK